MKFRILPLVIGAALAVSHAAYAQSELDTEIKNMMDIAKTYGTAWQLDDSKFSDFLKIVRERDEKLKYCSSIFQKYKADIEAKNETGNLVKQKIGWVKSQFDLFFSSANQFATNFKRDVDNNTKLARQRIDEAEKQKLFALCDLAIHELEQNIRMAQILQAFNGDDDPTAKEVLLNVEPLMNEAKTKMAAIKKATARVVKAPVENYSGADKEKHRAAIKSAWLKEHQGDKIIKIVFPQAWNRKNEWTHNGNGNWSQSDMSYLVAWVIVQKDAKTATMYPAYVNKNNLSGSITYGVQTKGGSYVNDDIELSKVK